MKKMGWILAVALVLLVGWAAYGVAQQGMGGMMGGGMMGQSGPGTGPGGAASGRAASGLAGVTVAAASAPKAACGATVSDWASNADDRSMVGSDVPPGRVAASPSGAVPAGAGGPFGGRAGSGELGIGRS